MHHLEGKVSIWIDEFLKPIEKLWQPTDFLPVSTSDTWEEDVKELRYAAKDLPYDFITVLVGDTITEEALPTYESWLMDVVGVDQHKSNGWSKWVRWWTAEENRHGDLLNKYLYLSGRVDMKAFELSTHYLIADGFDIGTDRDPYKNFIYTSFQEKATNISHRRTASIAKQYDNGLLAKMCGVIAADEMRHHKAYKHFVSQIFEVDPSNMMKAFEDMMRHKIVMPAHFLRELGGQIGSKFAHFSEVAQRIGVYTTLDYIEILESLIKDWKIDKLTDLDDTAEKSRDYIMKLPNRLRRLMDRVQISQDEFKFSWIS